VRIQAEGPQRVIRGILFDGDRCPPCAAPWPLIVDDKEIGSITTAIWSPRFEQNVALGMVDRGYWDQDQKVMVATPDGLLRSGAVIELPFPDVVR